MCTDIVENDELPRPAPIILANGVKDASTNQGGQKLFDEEGKKNARDEGKVEIVNHEGTVEHKGLTILHQFTTAEDDDIVCDEANGRLFQGRHGGGPRYEEKIVGGVANDALESLVEDWP